jgi:hypothetical protein
MTKNNKIYQTFTTQILLLFVLLSLLSFSPHKEYYSLTKIDYNEKEKALQITIQVFIYDMELGLNKQYDSKLELGTKREIINSKQIIKNYLIKNFEISIDKNLMSEYDLLGKEYDKDMMYLYLEINNIEEINTVSIRNSVLMETFIEQENIVRLNINKQHKSLILTSENDKGMLKF